MWWLISERVLGVAHSDGARADSAETNIDTAHCVPIILIQSRSQTRHFDLHMGSYLRYPGMNVAMLDTNQGTFHFL